MWPAPIWTVEVHGDGAAPADPAAVVGELGPDLLGAGRSGCSMAALEPGTSAAVIVWENRWAAPVAAAVRRSGGQLVASGRIPVQQILASLDSLEART